MTELAGCGLGNEIMALAWFWRLWRLGEFYGWLKCA